MKKIGFGCSESELISESDIKINDILGSNRMLLGEFKKGSLDTLITLKDYECKGALVGRQFALSNVVRKFYGKLAKILGKEGIKDIHIFEDVELETFEGFVDGSYVFSYANGILEDIYTGVRYDSLLVSFYSILKYLNSFKIPLSSIYITSVSGKPLGMNELNSIKTCNMGWCSCAKSSVLRGYWSGRDIPHEYFTAILI